MSVQLKALVVGCIAVLLAPLPLGLVVSGGSDVKRVVKADRAERAAVTNARIDWLYAATGRQPPPEFYASYEAYEDWQAVEALAQADHGPLGVKERAQLLNTIIPKHTFWKNVKGYGYYTTEEINSWSDADASRWFDSVTRVMFHARWVFFNALCRDAWQTPSPGQAGRCSWHGGAS